MTRLRIWKGLCACWIGAVLGPAGAASALALENPAVMSAPKLSSASVSPWGIGVSAEWAGEYPRFNPLLEAIGVQSLRLFAEWQTIQPRQGQWNWQVTDRMVEEARAHHLELLGGWCYFAPWASADGGTRKGPVKDIQYWRDYVSATAKRYQNDIHYWEVWNEFNGSFCDGTNKVQDYAALTVAAYDEVKKINPALRVGLSVANFDLAFLDNVIRAGAGDHFDFVCVHPYENLGAVADGGEVGYLSLVGNLRDMLAANHQRGDIPLWITEVGFGAPVQAEPARDLQQSSLLAKAYLLSLAQGFERVYWFEVRGPDYGGGTDFGILRPDWTPRPSYQALKVLNSG